MKDRKFYRVVKAAGTEHGRCVLSPGPEGQAGSRAEAVLQQRKQRQQKKSNRVTNARASKAEATAQPRFMQVGDRVKHRSRPDIGVGTIIEIIGHDCCTVQFDNCKFSGIPLAAIGTIEDVEQEQLAMEVQQRQAQALDEQRTRARSEAEYASTEPLVSGVVERFSRYNVQNLWHLTHKKNVRNILTEGILNHYDAHRHANCVDISDPDVQRRRDKTECHYGRSLHEYVPLYINPRNPMLFVRRHLQEDLCIIAVSLYAIPDGQFLITDGNAASRDTQFFNTFDCLDSLPWDVLGEKYWTKHPDGTRKMCAEVLVHPKVRPDRIQAIHCYSSSTQDYLANCGREVLITPKLFF